MAAAINVLSVRLQSKIIEGSHLVIIKKQSEIGA